MANRIQLRRDTAANWTTNNPILSQGEIGIETDGLNSTEVKRKIGDGLTAWVSLPYDQSTSTVTSVASKTGIVTLESPDIIDFSEATDKRITTVPYVSRDPKTKLFVTNFDEGPGDWVFSGTGSITHNIYPTETLLGTGSIKITASSDNTVNTAKKTLLSAIDLSSKRVARLRILANSKDNIDKDANGVVLRLYSGVGDYVDLNITRRVFKRCNTTTDFRYIDINFGNLVTDNKTETGTLNYSAITDIELRVTARTGVGASVSFNELIFHEPELDKAQIVIQWDDNHRTLDEEITAAMSKYGLVGEVGFISDVFEDQGSGYTPLEWYEEIQKIGWSIANHGKSYTGWNDATTLAELETDFFGCWDVMSNNGMLNKDVFIFPQGDTQDDLGGVTNLIQKYCIAGRLTGDLGAFSNQWPNAEPHRMHSLNLNSSTTLLQAKAAVDEAIAEKSVLILYSHYLTDGAASGVTWNRTDFDDLASYIFDAINNGDCNNSTLGSLFRGNK